ncbi:hypothetical protein K788_0003924 [Paraburkholderia caribensis MBA4]|uniref:Uncharacterized protein n=1 Tax=Paraburkholderia caribensis MBA4 TaxID=1323664 RepID=A0A0P0RAZ6_9BURK|nr:hypothetical protein K788_0003924 [Paraburkholderia caribensis MBA4]
MRVELSCRTLAPGILCDARHGWHMHCGTPSVYRTASERSTR